MLEHISCTNYETINNMWKILKFKQSLFMMIFEL